MPDKAKYHSTVTPEANAPTTSTPASRESQTRKQSAAAGSAPPSNADTSSDRPHTCRNSSPKPRLSLTSPESSTGTGRDLSPYWSDFTAEINSLLWLPTGTDSPDSALNSSGGLSSKTAGSLLVLNQSDGSPESEFTEDLLSILHTFSRRIPGLRRRRSAIPQDKSPSDNPAEADAQDLDGRQPVDLQPDG